ncbi:type VI secretion system protein ImpE [Paraburkholderia sp. BL18I3N2]|uniref:type VI secretion system accessory protein TagJ n=1 Tax=Paraburkholderia sp. BL18I3N2 TaxID=1938799 RepID=UPI000D0765E1|nr:type VI secretion system accessory protein TagJ [Paraburkholderia sp. BL18I3N2]PRX32028.1 type VI secretion system protein ImpE [Paraburkholderia sp. BL18I3N2]
MTAQPLQDVFASQERERSPAAQIEMVEANIRSQPTLATHRWMLFQWLCITYQWTRAIQQLQVFAQLEPSQGSVAHACRDLIRAEHWRAKVMAGQQEPGWVFGDAPAWIHGMLSALKLSAQGQQDASDDARERALDLAPLVPGHTSNQRFEWIADSDSRLGPVCELITAGRYRWLSLADLASWRIERPSTLLDLVWAPCTLSLTDGAMVRGFMPARYPLAAHGSPVPRATLQLGHETVWHESGRTAVIASGRKTWTTSAADFDLFELADCSFGPAAVDGAAHSGAAAGVQR